ncbi:MAG: ATP-dependent helicase [Alphaproteobacteria bacterium]|nr:ATP-dependent helicase [Alphaproteobacteria bacterium]
MTFVTCPDRDRILDADGHVLVTGGPGCGKTTVALRKALMRIGTGLLPGQKVLFLSFSRAAVARIAQAARKDLPKESRRHLDIQTFHSFCWQIVRGHGYLLGAVSPVCLLPPHDERALRNGAKDDDPAWDAERERLFLEEGRIAFDLFAPKALALLHGSAAHRKLIADRYPLIIVDEAQDTGTEQWACMEALAGLTQLVCLADLEQQIYDFRRDVSPERLKQIMAALAPLEVDLGVQNNRSPGAEIVRFGNDILAQTPRGSAYNGVSQLSFRPDAALRDRAIRAAVGMLWKKITDSTGSPPESIGYLTNWGKGVTIIARALQGGDGVQEIPHRVVMDEAEVLLATRVVALCLEPIEDVWGTLTTGLELIAELYRARGNAKKADQLTRNAGDAREGRVRGNAKCPPSLKSILEHLKANPLSGNPSQDWLTVRHLFEASGTAELQFVARQVIYLMGFNRGRRISDALAQVWQRRDSYEGARALIEAAITEDQIMGSDGDLTGINVMTMHKSKGKEFDGVIILHLGNSMSPLSPDNEPAPHMKSRRLLRVGITRAKKHVLMLTDAYSPSPLLAGHNLNRVVP